MPIPSILDTKQFDLALDSKELISASPDGKITVSYSNGVQAPQTIV
jgi:hypothetical protein